MRCCWMPGAEPAGGTGHRLDPAWLTQVDERIHEATPWWLAGGVSAEWVPSLLNRCAPRSGLSQPVGGPPRREESRFGQGLVTAVKAFRPHQPTRSLNVQSKQQLIELTNMSGHCSLDWEIGRRSGAEQSFLLTHQLKKFLLEAGIVTEVATHHRVHHAGLGLLHTRHFMQ